MTDARRLPRFDCDRAPTLVAELEGWGERADLREAVASLRERRGAGAEFLGWMDLPHREDEEGARLLRCADRLRNTVDTLVVVGIGGSYLGARALLDALRWKLRESGGPEILFAGHHLEASGLQELLESLDGRSVGINVISKSGTTTEPAIAFRLLRRWLEERHGVEEASRRIVATTDARRGALRTLAGEQGYETFVVPDDVGGRFSVLSPVGLLPLAVAGVDVRSLRAGAAAEATRCESAPLGEIPAAHYAVYRHVARQKGLGVEVLASFHPSLHHLSEWWKQLFGESEGKEGRGLFPAAVDYTTDLHSLGQYLQEGRRQLLETFLRVEEAPPGPALPSDPADPDGLEYLAGRSVAEINAVALDAVADAHAEGGMPVAEIATADLHEDSLGALIFFFEFAVAIGGRLLEVNPFDQPGVEAYKRNLFRRLGKPGS